ncbi:putative membrane protein [Allocatelliglobosispora scoriae]|uniref:Putative membrane protein n=1 Tax=Allocatelliglobosispora scoriae TaxID=643052 RepID=A0A841C4B9_9ACTN|nr:YibE/F family protein [Allocatelliglobosispora scoriae]MBB5873902.1 putative membrane protein [Allocatelliglobosispora scoriae]
MGAGHSHTHAPIEPSRRGLRVTLAVLIPAVLLTIAALAWLWPPPVQREAPTDGYQQVNGVVLAIVEQACPQVPEEEPGIELGPCGTVSVRLGDGPDAGTTIDVDLPAGPGAPIVHAGDDVVLQYLPDATFGDPYQIADHQRSTPLWVLGIAFALAVVAFGRLRGLTALAGLGITFGILLWFIVPAILAGKPPLLVAIVGAAAIMLTVLYLTHGLSATTSVAVAGTLIALALTGVLSAVAVSAVHLTGVADDSSMYLQLSSNVNMQGLLLAGILIGALGVLDDITVTQSMTVTELARANPDYGFRDLYGAAARVGRAHIASVINTIILAYAGASLPVMLLIADSDTPGGEVLTNPMIATELVRAIVGTLGLIAAVPVTTALAALVSVRSRSSSPDSSHDAGRGGSHRPAVPEQQGWEPVTADGATWHRPDAPTHWAPHD